MNVAIIGYGVDGASATGYWHHMGANITICDKRTDLLLPNYATPKLGENYLKDLDQFDLIVRSSGIRPDLIANENPDNPNILDKVTTAINEFFAKCPAPIIGVTGTKGKGTTCTLIYKILEAAGKKVFIGGNIGTVPLDFLHEVTPDSWVVLELSSFQLFDFKYAPKIGVCVMVVPEHQDWHKSIAEYYNSKKQLFIRQTAEDFAIFNSANPTSVRIADSGKATKIPYYVPPKRVLADTVVGAYVEGDQICMEGKIICDVADVALLGRHNLENVCAAIAATWSIIGEDKDIIKKVVQEFSGMEHRLEFVRELDGVKYYNDRFATTPEATVAAMHSFDQPKVLILGGSDKGIPIYDVIGEIALGNVRRVIIIGETGEKIIEMLVSRGYENMTLGGNTMSEIVTAARHAAKPGDVVLLSTAYASFDMFKNYKDRGEQFRNVVNSLQ
jgi:UDP-N-acetylmuramoylalanine--D-glutamate ligase